MNHTSRRPCGVQTFYMFHPHVILWKDLYWWSDLYGNLQLWPLMPACHWVWRKFLFAAGAWCRLTRLVLCSCSSISTPWYLHKEYWGKEVGSHEYCMSSTELQLKVLDFLHNFTFSIMCINNERWLTHAPVSSSVWEQHAAPSEAIIHFRDPPAVLPFPSLTVLHDHKFSITISPSRVIDQSAVSLLLCYHHSICPNF